MFVSSSRKKTSKSSGDEWIGGRFRLHWYVRDGETPYRPEVVIWIDQESSILGLDVLKPQESEDRLADLLERCIVHPAVGLPRQPSSIRVATQAVADTLRPRFPSMRIRVSPTHELSALAHRMEQGLNGDPRREESYLEGGWIPAPVVAGFFEAAAHFGTVAPWTIVPGYGSLRLDIPTWKREGLFLSVMGQMGQELGLALFDDYETYDRLVRSTRSTRPTRLPGRMFGFAFMAASQLPGTMRREAMRHGWKVLDAQHYPHIMFVEGDLSRKPLTKDDMTLLSAATETVSLFFDQHPQWPSRPTRERFVLQDGVETILTAPYA
jgi:hypothetical protein